jgi:hypothetical protein
MYSGSKPQTYHDPMYRGSKPQTYHDPMYSGSKPQTYHDPISVGPKPQTYSQAGHMNYNPDYQSQGWANETNKFQYYEDQKCAKNHYYEQKPKLNNPYGAKQNQAPSQYMGARYPHMDELNSQSLTGDYHGAYGHEPKESMSSPNIDLPRADAVTFSNPNDPTNGSTKLHKMNRF